MDRHALLRLANSCGLLLIPALAWNIALAGQLPPAFSQEVFWKDIPTFLTIAENATRTLVFVVPFLMPLEIATPVQRRGLAIFVAGTLIYFGSWLPLMISPSSAWSTSAVGFMTPAYTPALWLFGLAIVGRRLFWGRFYQWWFYLAVAALFLSAHIEHTRIVYARTLPAGA